MRRHTLIATLCAVAGLTLLSGCAGLGPVSPPPGSGALRPDSELVGTWTGSLNWVAPSLYDDEANLRLQIRDDGAFTVTVTPRSGWQQYRQAVEPGGNCRGERQARDAAQRSRTLAVAHAHAVR